MTSERPGQPEPVEPGAETAPYTPPSLPPATTPGPPPVTPAGPPPVTPGGGWAPPVPPRQEVAPGLVFADTASRFVAYVVDLLLVAIVTGIIAEPLGWNVAPPVGEVADLDQAWVTTEYTVLATVLSALYFVLSWSGGRRATLGQRLFKIQVGNAFDGRPLTLEQAVRRWLGFGDFINVFGFTPTLGLLTTGLLFFWTIVLLITTATSPTKQGLHDRIANTAVVRPAAAGSGLAMACLVIVVALLVLSVVAIVALIFLGNQVSSILSQVGESV